MTPEQRKAAAWAVQLLESFFALTGMEPNRLSRGTMQALREMAK